MATALVAVGLALQNSSWILGQTGRVVIDDNGDLEPDWALWYNSPDTDGMIRYMEFSIGPDNTNVSVRSIISSYLRCD